MEVSKTLHIFEDMFVKPWSLKEGFVVGALLTAAGVLLQVVLGPVRWEALAWPVNFWLLAAGLILIVTAYALRRRVYFFEWMMHNGAGVPALVYALGLTMVMGLTVQGGHGMPWLGQMLRFWPFVLAWGWVVLIAGLAGLNHLLRWKLREIPFLLNHCGVFLAVVAATLGAPDKQDVKLMAYTDTPEWRAVDSDGRLVVMDFSIELHQFIMETYEDGTPKRFASDISVVPVSGEGVRGIVDVNKPLKYGRWKIYQSDYDEKAGAESAYSTFELVRDPWLPFVYIGIFMMLLGALCLMLFMAPKPDRREAV